MVRRIGAATALEARASGVHWAFAPCVAVSQLLVFIEYNDLKYRLNGNLFLFFLQVLGDPRWGRSYECYGEDTGLVSEMTSLVSGLQGEPPEEHPNGYPFVAGRYHQNTLWLDLESFK